MSEFACRLGHEIPPGEFVCRYCGGRVYYMDGLNPQEAAGLLEVYDEDGKEFAEYEKD